jgi:hypothetical protein
MKKFFILSVSLMTLSAVSFAQTTFGIKAGLQSTALNIAVDADDEDAVIGGNSTGFVFGGVADIKFSGNWSFQPQLLLAMKNGSLETSSKTNILAIDIPLNVLYRTNGFFVGVGPNLSYGLSGKAKPFGGGDDQDLYEEEGGDEAIFKRFEFGVNALMGYDFPGGFSLSANFTPGISDILNEDVENTKVHTRMFGINFGYMFNKGAAKKK